MPALKLSDERRRKEQICACFTKDEKMRVTKAALNVGLAPSIFLRNAALAMTKEKADERA